MAVSLILKYNPKKKYFFILICKNKITKFQKKIYFKNLKYKKIYIHYI